MISIVLTSHLVFNFIIIGLLMIIHNHYLFLFHIQQFKRCSCVESYEPDPATVGCYLRAPMVTVVSPNLTFSMHVLLVPQASRPY